MEQQQQQGVAGAGEPGLAALPAIAIERILSATPQPCCGALRATGRAQAGAIARHLAALSPRPQSPRQLAEQLQKLPCIAELRLERAPPVFFGACSSYARLDEHTAALQQQLTRAQLTSLTLSSLATQQLGALKWAHHLTRMARKPGASSSWCPLPPSDCRSQVHWVPDWLAASPGLRRLCIKPPACSGTDAGLVVSLHLPAILWLRPGAWSDKLTTLEISGLALASMPPIMRHLALHHLALTGCRLGLAAVSQLLRQLEEGHGGQLHTLDISDNELLSLPRDGWHALRGLQALDVSRNELMALPDGLGQLASLTQLRASHNQLAALPGGLAHCTALQLLDASHNWLSGGRQTPLAELLAAWAPSLAVLRLSNTSDKRGELQLLPQLGGCTALRELHLGRNFALDWSSLAVLRACTGLEVLVLPLLHGGRPVPQELQQLQAQRPSLCVTWE